VVVLVGGVVPEVDAPDGSGLFALVGVAWICLGLVPDVDGVGAECGELEEVELLGLLSVGNAGAGGGARGAGAGAVAGVEGMTSVGPNGFSLWTDVQLY
jgi:hypothetical protein